MSLVLSRNIGQTIMIGDDVAVTVVGVKGGQVRLSIDAPKYISVDREEIRARINGERLAALTQTRQGE